MIDDLKKKIIDGLSRGKAMILPAMAVGRSQELACIVGDMKLEGLIDSDVDLYLAGMATMKLLGLRSRLDLKTAMLQTIC